MLDTLSMYILPGMTKKFKAHEYFAQLDPVNHRSVLTGEYSEQTPVNGFIVDDDQVGSILPVEGEAAVYYTQKRYAPNAITFYGRRNTGTIGPMGRILIVSVPIHDHSSIVTGGPAYGTYFTDDEAVGD